MIDTIGIYHLINKNNTKVKITNYGAIIMDIEYDGISVVHGFDRVESYWDPTYRREYPYFGAFIGRYANRINQGRFTLDGKSYTLSTNFQGHTLHGGYEGFDSKIWNVVSYEPSPLPTLQLFYESKDGDEGFPGNMKITVTFSLHEDDALHIAFHAISDIETPLNFTHHDYFNLNGSGDILAHSLYIPATSLLEQQDDMTVSGNKIAVKNTEWDFLTPRKIKHPLTGKSDYDQSYVSDITNTHQPKAILIGNNSLIHLAIFSSCPIVHLYTAPHLPILPLRNGHHSGSYSACSIECQEYPDAVNISSFPTVCSSADKPYNGFITYRFSKNN